MNITRLGIHDSVRTVFPPERLREAIATGGRTVSVVSDESVPDCDAIVTFDHRDVLLSTDWVHSIQAGVDKFPFEAFERAGTALTNSTGIHGTTVGETVAGYMLSFARRLHRHRDHQRERTWAPPDWDAAFTLEDERLCVVGLGTLGRGIADHARGLGMAVDGVRRSGESLSGIDRVYAPDELEDAIATARFVAIAVPLTDETRGMIGADEIATMPADGYLMNVARGPIVDQSALIAGLETGEIAGAALDVFDPEPLPADSPLWERDEVIVTPHCAAFDRDYYLAIADLVRENLDRIDTGKPMTNRVV